MIDADRLSLLLAELRETVQKDTSSLRWREGATFILDTIEGALEHDRVKAEAQQ